MTFGEKLLFLRKQKKYTQEFVAKHLGIAKSTYCGYEIDNREPSLEKIKYLSELFDVPPAFLLGTGVFSNWEEIQKHKQEIIETLNSLTKDLLPFKLDYSVDVTLFIRLLDILVAKISCTDDNLTIFPKIPLDNNDTQKSTAPAETDKDDANKQKLMNNYDKMNEKGQNCLVQYSDYLADKPENLKSTVDLDKREA